MEQPTPADRDLSRLRAALARPAPDPSSDFDLNAEVAKLLPPNRVLRPAAVLCPVIARPHGLDVILTRRSSQLKQHPGQVAFPGGKIDATDADARAAALREAEEEIGLPRDAVEILGELPVHETVTGFRMHPFVGLIPPDFVPVPEAGEVEEAFAVPLAFLTDPANRQVHGRAWRGHVRRYYAMPYGPYYIWGATARVLKSLSDLTHAH
ncbi:CoA pyrophosphatase [Roseobacter sp. HKCCA0434]|uniref:CoA pyrophosphatase n=1 Tax=Roseobacter sp. HKCCA0434 TaxID=3079297 RepID=UPI002905822F|nr:CoA pyrophosphatase [Roseobacter sp. HKCCA0434]